MIHIPVICKSATNVSSSPSITRIFAKAASAILRDVAIAIGDAGPGDKGQVVTSEGALAVSITFDHSKLTILRQTNTRTDFGPISEVFLIVETANCRTTSTCVEKLDTAAQQLHFINSVRSKRNIALWSMQEFLGRNLSRLPQAA